MFKRILIQCVSYRLFFQTIFSSTQHRRPASRNINVLQQKQGPDSPCNDAGSHQKKGPVGPCRDAKAAAPEPAKKPSIDPRRVFKVYRFNGILSGCSKPKIQSIEIDVSKCGPMVLDAMLLIKDMDPSFTFRRSCREGICGSCAVNVQGSNRLACITEIPKQKTITLYPLPHMYVVRDLVVDMEHFVNAYNLIRPYLITSDKKFKIGGMQLAQSQRDNDKMVGLYECVLCGCCSTACPSYWWNGRRFLGPAALLHAYRWVIDSRDEGTYSRLSQLRDDFMLFRCHTILNCTLDCPKGLNPALAIVFLKRLVAGLDTKTAAEIAPKKFMLEKNGGFPKS